MEVLCQLDQLAKVYLLSSPDVGHTISYVKESSRTVVGVYRKPPGVPVRARLPNAGGVTTLITASPGQGTVSFPRKPGPGTVVGPPPRGWGKVPLVAVGFTAGLKQQHRQPMSS